LVTGDVEQVAAALVAGEVVGLPTDTVYGLGAKASIKHAVEQIFDLKSRPPDLALPVLVSGLAQAEDVVGAHDPGLARMATVFWPGALTVVVALRRPLGVDLGGDGSSVGLRCPADDALRMLCTAVGPLAVTSANRHGEPPVTSAAQFAQTFGDTVRLVLDGGVRNRVPSSVVSVAGAEPRLLREGPIAWPEIVAAMGPHVVR
jgi:L-threonylcarbamoyladenylate synthase